MTDEGLHMVQGDAAIGVTFSRKLVRSLIKSKGTYVMLFHLKGSNLWFDNPGDSQDY